jgi:hypothetical protein
MDTDETPICCGYEMLYSEFASTSIIGEDVYFCSECGKMVDKETGEVLDAGSE